MDIKTAQSSAGLPVIYITDPAQSAIPALSQVYGMERKPRTQTWFAPGFYPFGLWVLGDLKEIGKIVKINLDGVKKLEEELLEIDRRVEKGDMAGYHPKVEPYEHQKECLSLAIHNPRLGLFLDPGLGKTKIACDLILHSLREKQKSFWIIVALKVNLFTWYNEMSFHSGGSKKLLPVTKTGKARKKALEKALGEEDVVGIVVTYDTVRVALDLLVQEVPYTDVVLDESHSLRTPGSGKTKAVLKLLSAKPVARRLLLTGTPSLGNPMHLWGQLKALGKFLVPNQWAFGNTYIQRSPGNRHMVLGYKNMDRLNDLVTSVSIKKTGDECLDLPPRTIQVIEIAPSPKTRGLYNKTAGGNKVKIGDLELGEPPNPLTKMTRLAQLVMGFSYKSLKDPEICDGCPYVTACVRDKIEPYTQRCKVETKDPGRLVGETGGREVIDSVKDLVTTHTNGGKKVIVWGKHRWVLDQLAEELKPLGVPTFRYDSTVKDLPEVEAEFNKSSEGIIVAQISMGIGVTFKAPVMVYAELSWSLDHWLQSLDRNYGIRARGYAKLLVQVVVTRGSLNHKVSKLLKEKISLSNLMYSRIECVSCPRILKCLDQDISPFEPECVMTQAKTKTIQIERI